MNSPNINVCLVNKYGNRFRISNELLNILDEHKSALKEMTFLSADNSNDYEKA